MFGLKTEELVIVLVIVVLLFGGKKIPELSKSIGQAIREIRKGFTDDTTKDSEGETIASSKKNSSKAPKKTT